MNKLRIYFVILILSASSTESTIKSELKKTLIQTCKAAELVSTFIATHFALSLLHQKAHAITAQIALNNGAQTDGNPTIALAPFNYGIFPAASYPEFKNGLVNALVSGIAPIVGIAGAYGILKAHNIVHEYLRHRKFKRALIDGMKKKLINNDQLIGVRWATQCHMIGQSLSLVPLAIPFYGDKYKSHGYQILKDLKIIRS